MSEFVVRALAEGEQRAAFDLVFGSLHRAPTTEEVWAQREKSYPAEGKFGAFADDRLIGVAGSFETELAVPGGKTLATAAVDGVGVRADHTRRGVLTALMDEQLRSCLERGDVLAALHASEAVIYGRFGYGAGTRNQTLRVSRAAARFREDAPRGGRVRLLEAGEADTLIPSLYQRIGLSRPGMIGRPETWWSYARTRMREENLVAVHTGPDGDDGFVCYRPVDLRSFEEPVRGAALEVRDLHAANVSALAGLWRYLLKVDLVSEVRAGRPLDEPLGAMLVDPRACHTVSVDDELWVRLVDVPAALAARSYRPAKPVVLEVIDTVLPVNSGRYRVAEDGVTRTGEPAQLRLAVDTLAMLYLGEWAATTLADAGRIEVMDSAAPGRADELFRTPVRPWCGSSF